MSELYVSAGSSSRLHVRLVAGCVGVFTWASHCMMTTNNGRLGQALNEEAHSGRKTYNKTMPICGPLCLEMRLIAYTHISSLNEHW